MENVTTSTEKRFLKCKITDEESNQLGKDLAAKEAQLGTIMSEKAAAMASFKSRHTIVEEEIKELSAAINQGGVHKYVEVILKRDYNEMTYTETRADDPGNPLVLRDLVGAERQMPLTEEEKTSAEDSDGTEDDEANEADTAPGADDNEGEEPADTAAVDTDGGNGGAPEEEEDPLA